MDVLCTWIKLLQINKFGVVNCTEIAPDPLGSYSAPRTLQSLLMEGREGKERVGNRQVGKGGV